jgi:2-polyprenyl-6-methoxyphenol hydroxylase-like FAD-dependent oxidoreductase
VLSAAQLPEADLILAADGANSRIRQANPNFGTDIRMSQDKYIWLGTDRIFDAFAFHFVQTSGGWLWAATYGVGSKLSTFVVQCSPETWTSLGFDTMQAADSLAILEELFKDQLDGHRLMGQVGDAANARWLNFRNVSNQSWHDGKVVLAGDSAHTTHFSIGQGTGLAIEDAIALAENVYRCDDLELALESYEQQRRAEMRLAQSKARLSGQWFENLSRYVALEPRQFAVLLHARCSPLLPLLPPRLFYQLQRASQEVVILRKLRKRQKAVVKRALPSANWVNSQLTATALSDHPGLGYREPAGIRRRR